MNRFKRNIIKKQYNKNLKEMNDEDNFFPLPSFFCLNKIEEKLNFFILFLKMKLKFFEASDIADEKTIFERKF